MGSLCSCARKYCSVLHIIVYSMSFMLSHPCHRLMHTRCKPAWLARSAACLVLIYSKAFPHPTLTAIYIMKAWGMAALIAGGFLSFPRTIALCSSSTRPTNVDALSASHVHRTSTSSVHLSTTCFTAS